jgi:hypothetical protein
MAQAHSTIRKIRKIRTIRKIRKIRKIRMLVLRRARPIRRDPRTVAAGRTTQPQAHQPPANKRAPCRARQLGVPGGASGRWAMDASKNSRPRAPRSTARCAASLVG